MQWSIALGRIGGIEVRLHVTFLLLLVWIGVSYYAVGGVAAAISALAFIGALFGSVLLHELGHAFAARRFGVRTPDITLLPIGGVARLERIPDSPRAELAIALAGPAVNIVLAAVLYVLATIAGRIDALGGIHLFGGTFLGRILFVNLWLALFNLLPAFPMDGGPCCERHWPIASALPVPLKLQRASVKHSPLFSPSSASFLIQCCSSLRSLSISAPPARSLWRNCGISPKRYRCIVSW